jgi:hypothetical protein
MSIPSLSAHLPRRSGAPVAVLALLLGGPAGLGGCTAEEPKDDTPTPSADDGGDGGADGADGGDGADSGEDGADTGEDTPPIDVCATLGLPALPMDTEGPFGLHRRERMGDFSLPLRGGETFSLSESWTGCEIYSFLPHGFVVSSLDRQTWWSTGVEDLVRRSPLNVHYFFVVSGSSADDAEAFGAQMDAWIEEGIAGLRPDDQAWWADRLHVVAVPGAEISGQLGEVVNSGVGELGFSIDRDQRIAGHGYMSAVEAYREELSLAEEWPWEWRLYSAANEPVFLNFEAERAARMAEVEATVVPIFESELHDEYEDDVVVLPAPEVMAGFDTLEVEVFMECPDREASEVGNCGAWDYIANLWLYDGETDSWLEMARFITTYHRESHWVVDATHALAWLQAGGERTVRYSWAPSWNTQPTIISVNLRLSNQGKGSAPRQAFPLFNGGAFNSAYNDREPVEVAVPAGAARVELVSILTGHGMDTATNCAEFCPHEHQFTVGEAIFTRSYAEAGTSRGCQLDIPEGVVPNQAGTWWFGRGGWCPGQEVRPWVEDVTAAAPAGSAVSVRYEGRLSGATPPDTSGNIELRSWLVVYE